MSSFDEHVPAAVTASGAGQGTLSAVRREPNVYTNIPDAPPSTAVNVLLLDGLNTPVENQLQVRQQMLQYLTKIEPGTQLAVFTLASRLRMVQGFTANVGDLKRAMLSKKAAQTSVILDPAGDNEIDSMIGDMASIGASSEALSGMRQFQADLTSYQTDVRVRMTLEAMQQLARYLSAVPGRKNLIWFSGAFPLNIDPPVSNSAILMRDPDTGELVMDYCNPNPIRTPRDSGRPSTSSPSTATPSASTPCRSSPSAPAGPRSAGCSPACAAPDRGGTSSR